MLIKSKFAGRCKRCGAPIAVGEWIYWEKGKGAKHRYCAAGAENVRTKELPQDAPQHGFDALRLLLNAAKAYIAVAPLLFGPLYFSGAEETAWGYCVYATTFVGLAIGLAPLDYKIRVKWGSRRAFKADVYLTWVWLGIGISVTATWLVVHISKALE